MNSALNPEAPEFYPNFSSVTQDGLIKVCKAVKSANNLPAGASQDIFKTFSDFNLVATQLTENVVSQSSEIVLVELPSVKLRRNDSEYNTEKIIDANDSLLDRIYIQIDTVKGLNKPNDKFLEGVTPAASVSNSAPVIAKIQVGSATLIGAKNVPRPQIKFKDQIDNSNTFWVPKISDKPNSFKPLALNILYDDKGEPVGYEHPYKMELDMYQPPSHCLEADNKPPSFPPSLEETNFTLVDTEALLDDLIEHLSTVNEVAVDVEHHSYRTYQGITCLIQISTNEGGDFIIDALEIREHVHKLNLIFTDPNVIKVFHGSGSDIIWLQRDFGVYIVGLFDTHCAAKALKLAGLSLKYLLFNYCEMSVNKMYQMADWRIRPLPAELIEYARMDTHYLIYIWRIMKAELLMSGDRNAKLLLSVFDESRRLCELTYTKEVVHDNSHLLMYRRSKKSFNFQQMSALKLIYKWRDLQARQLDESTTYLLPNHMVLALAERMPRDIQGINACCNPMPPFVKQNLINIHRMLLSCGELPGEPQLYQMPSGIKNMMNTVHQSIASVEVHDLGHFLEYSDNENINLNVAADLLVDPNKLHPEVNAFQPIPNNETGGVGSKPNVKSELNVGSKVDMDTKVNVESKRNVESEANVESEVNVESKLNVDAKMFIPPYDRYRKYRFLAQIEEIKEFKDKEAKIAAIGKGNTLIKEEVLHKLQDAQIKIADDDQKNVVQPNPTDVADNSGSNVATQRKRKISFEKLASKVAPKEPPKEPPKKPTRAEMKKEEEKPPANEPTKPEMKEEEEQPPKYNDKKANVKSYVYKNANYKKFHDNAPNERTQPKLKYKKHKK